MANNNFLDGYGITAKEYIKMEYGIKVFNILNYTETIEKLTKKKDKNQLELYGFVEWPS
jgi:hypothetical protein